MIWAQLGAMMMVVAVGLGAFGAHALKSRLTPEMHAIFEVGVRYHVYHALALIAVAWLSSVRAGNAVTASGLCFVAGIVLFSGSLYAYALTGAKLFVFVTPFGGLLFLAGWVAFFLGARSAS